MSAIKKTDSFGNAPKVFRKKPDGPGRKYNDAPSKGRYAGAGFKEENTERRPARSYGFEKRDREPMHVIRKPLPQETRRPVRETEEARLPVPGYKLKKGWEAAQTDILDMVETIVDSLSDSGSIAEVELAVSFNHDGRFIGFGVGGSATIKIKIAPMG